MLLMEFIDIFRIANNLAVYRSKWYNNLHKDKKKLPFFFIWIISMCVIVILIFN